MNSRKPKRIGSAYIVVTIFLIILFLLVNYYLTSTVQQGKFTDMSLRGIQAVCLAETAMERALHLVQRELQSTEAIDREKGKSDSLASLLRFPLKKSEKEVEGTSDKLGKDVPLDTKTLPRTVVLLRKNDLRLIKEPGMDELDKLVNFMTEGRAKDFDVTIKISIQKAFQIASQKPSEDEDAWKVPGVDLPWTIRDDVKTFLEGKPYPAFCLKFPRDLKILSFSIPLKIKIPYLGRLFKSAYKSFIEKRQKDGGSVTMTEREEHAETIKDKDEITLGTIDIMGIVDAIICKALGAFSPTILGEVKYQIGAGKEDGIIARLASLDFLAGFLINKVAPGKYPLTLRFDKIPMPKQDLWPRTPSDPNPAIKEAMKTPGDFHLEKYGELTFSCEASITMADGYKAVRRIEAVKEFKVADVEPPAPMYSFFVQNEANDFLTFNNLGGQFYVNNMSYGNFFSELNPLGGKTSKPPENAAAPADSNDGGKTGSTPKNEKDHEIPGLIRVNYSTESDKAPPMLVNVSLAGDPRPISVSDLRLRVPPIDTELKHSLPVRILLNMMKGVEVFLILTSEFDLTPVGGKTNLVVTYAPTKKGTSRKGKKAGKPAGSGVSVSTGETSWEEGWWTPKPKEEVKTPEQIAREKKREEFDKKHPQDPVTKKFIDKKLDDREDIADPSRLEKFLDKSWGLIKGLQPNVMPDVSAMSTNVILFGLTLSSKLYSVILESAPSPPKVVKDTADAIDKSPAGAISGNFDFSDVDCFEKWEMPYMGAGYTMGTIPSPGWETNKSHLFGYGALFPTLTREIEGKVCMQFRQWGMCILGLNPMDRLPVLPPPVIFLPPIPIPVWYSVVIAKKYGYSFFPFQSFDLTKPDDPLVEDVTPFDPSTVENLAPNLYSVEQYAKKANYFYENYVDFQKDLVHRVSTLPTGEKILSLNGVTFVSGNLGTEQQPFRLETVESVSPVTNSPTIFIAGKGMLVCSGNIFLGCDIRTVDYPDPVAREKIHRTVFSLVARNGGLVILPPKEIQQQAFAIEGSVYTEKGIFVPPDRSLHILGNWVTNDFKKGAMMGTVVVDYVSSKLRNSLGSLHPEWGKFDPLRYHVSLNPTWSSWRLY